jgi:hypothetical protein
MKVGVLSMHVCFGQCQSKEEASKVLKLLANLAATAEQSKMHTSTHTYRQVPYT